MNSEESEADTIGYAFLDVNHDGVTELIIGLISEEKEGKYYGQNIYSVYTYNDIPYLLLENCVLDENAIQLSCKDVTCGHGCFG